MNIFFSKKSYFFLVWTITVLHFGCKSTNDDRQTVYSPNKDIKIIVSEEGGVYRYAVFYKDKEVLQPSALGLKTETINLYDSLSVVDISNVEVVSDSYETPNAKRRVNSYKANKKTFQFVTAHGDRLDIIFQVSDDGVAFRYMLPEGTAADEDVVSEMTTFKFPTSAKGWLQPVAVAKSGWEQTNPSYEEHYQQGIAVGTSEPTNTGWVYPALFQSNEVWVSITEADLSDSYCATRLHADSPNGEYRIAFPDPREVMPPGDLLPKVKGDFFSPWRVLTIGDISTIVESSLGLDLARPETIDAKSDFIVPGKAAWSWVNSKDDFIVYDEQKKYIDFAADMNWQYCLIDVNWDTKIGYEKIQELVDYGKTKGVGILLWYNSAGEWNTVPYTPKNKILSKDVRRQEFARIQKMGVKGVKIDFFGGDGRSVIAYYHDILKDAAEYKLLVNFHGATLPRGWSRTYPHLMTVEAVRGFEMVTFDQKDADMQATLSTILPFTRNAYDPMDFTPMNLHKINSHVKRQTTAAFELATSVLFLSGIQHYAESPEGMSHVPDTIKSFLRTLPDYWEDVRFITGFPGKDVVIARQSGQKWYVAGINGEQMEKKIKLDFSRIGKSGNARLYADGKEHGAFLVNEVSLDSIQEITLRPNGGFVLVID